MYMPRVLIHLAAVCDPDPGGPGGYGVVLTNYETLYRKQISWGRSNTSGDRLSIIAATHAIKSLKTPCWVQFTSTSAYLIRALSAGHVERWQQNGWWLNPIERPKNIDLWKKFMGHFCGHRELSYRLVDDPDFYPPEIQRCEGLARLAMKTGDLPPDEGYADEANQGDPMEDFAHRLSLRCRHCATPLVPKESRKQDPVELFLDYYLICPGCNMTYLVPENMKLDYFFYEGILI